MAHARRTSSGGSSARCARAGRRRPTRRGSERLLLPGEHDLWRRMSGADRRHAVGVARRVERALGHEATRPVLAAALLHDVGKIESGLGTYGRVVATLSARSPAPTWPPRGGGSEGFARRVGLYLQHDRLGGDLLELAGSDPLTVAWAREHHRPDDRVDRRRRDRRRPSRPPTTTELTELAPASRRSCLRECAGRLAALPARSGSTVRLAQADGLLGPVEGGGGDGAGLVGALGEELGDGRRGRRPARA